MTERDWNKFLKDLEDPCCAAEIAKQIHDDPSYAAELRVKLQDAEFAEGFHAAAEVGRRALEAAQTARLLNDPGLLQGLAAMRANRGKEV